MARLTEEQVKEVVIGFIKQKYPNAHHISFTNIQFKGDLSQYWVDAFFRVDMTEAMCIYCRIESETGRITYHSFSLY